MGRVHGLNRSRWRPAPLSFQMPSDHISGKPEADDAKRKAPVAYGVTTERFKKNEASQDDGRVPGRGVGRR